jgi:hypothetical protein
MEPQEKATAAATLCRRSVSTAIVSRDGTTRRILRTDLLNPDDALFPVFLLASMIIAAQKQMLYLFEEPGGETCRNLHGAVARIGWPKATIGAPDSGVGTCRRCGFLNARRVLTQKLPCGGCDRRFRRFPTLYCGPVLRHPAELMLPAVDLCGRVWPGGKPCKGGPAAPAFGG